MIAIEVDGPSHFYANSTKYTAYTKLKHRLLSRMGYKVLHVPYFEWRNLLWSRRRWSSRGRRRRWNKRYSAACGGAFGWLLLRNSYHR
mmetsp:Transcript_16411/g.17867  ORF Transcript_16411/g.17867 Transcript_16411/m.17867 type:complete len:88 (-) Transcript_16411:153-416(-)